MKIAIMQPYFFPYIGYFQAIHSVDKYLIYDNLNFIKEGWINRNRFLVISEKPTFFHVELKNLSSFKKIRDIELIENNKWRHTILNGIFLNYKHAPYFEEVYPIVESVVNYPTLSLSELDYQGITRVCDFLEVHTEIERNAAKYLELEEFLSKEDIEENDFPEISVTGLQRKTIRILSICKREKADIFVNAIGGTKLYNKDDFEKNGIELHFVNTLEYKYKQLSTEFYPNLSIVDVLMNCGKTRTNKLIENYELI